MGTNPLVGPLLTDLYQVTMAYAYWQQGRHKKQAVFEVFFRKNPFKGEFTVFAGLEEVIRFVETYRLTESDVDYLRELLPQGEEGFFEWLRGLDCSEIKIYAIREGTVVFPAEPLLRIEGPLGIAQLLETTVLNLVNYASLVCTNAVRYRLAAPEAKLFEFGPRRAQGPDGAVSASRYTFIGGFDGTSNVLAGKLFGLPVSGTHSHAFVQSYAGIDDLPSETKINGVDIKARALSWRSTLGYDDLQLNDGEFAAFVAFALAFPARFIALVDTYSTLDTGLQNFLCVALALHDAGYQPIGIRIDSGDLAYLSRKARRLFDDLANDYDDDDEPSTAAEHHRRSRKAEKKEDQRDPSIARCLRKIQIFASNDINESVLLSLREQDHAIDGFGIGTHLVTCHNQPALGCVYKLVEIDGRPTIKLSNDINKTTIPCAKQAFRLISAEGVMILDLLVPRTHAPPEVGERILCRHPFDHNKRAYVTPTKVIALHKLVFDGLNAITGNNGDESPRGHRPSLHDIKNHVLKQLRLVRSDVLRPLNPTPYKISLTPELFSFFIDIWQENDPIRELK